MNKPFVTLSLTALLSATPAYAAFNLGSATDAASKLDSSTLSSLATGLAGKVNTQSGSPLVSALTDSLDVSSAQATAGSGSLLAYASSALSSTQSSELTSLVPGMDKLTSSLPGLSNTSTDMSGVSTIFNQLGMDSAMVSQFAPTILKYLSGQGASSELITSLTSLWQQ
ncbi:DUF2780 domain-containing protein [Vibrio salinus]|uniref:DUF2780 domain-containing protein n=1 Tax=Vibrio salinus TaxID=2899784 RepID=UPI001E35E2C2|nr:DUF2780 domain-containing protein [Vibrio salinus]MCE0494023.1 DUF2780 domain-containing protein [Vibrio salinus]